MSFANLRYMENGLPIITGSKGGDRKSREHTHVRLRTIRGVVVPADWDEKGNVIATAVSTHQEEFYIIESSGKGEELKAFLRNEVEVRGQVKGQKEKRINVQEFKCLGGTSLT